MSTQQFAVGASDKVFIEAYGKQIYAVQTHSIEENTNVKLVHGYGDQEAIGQTEGARQYSVSIETYVPLDGPDDTMSLYLVLRQPDTEIVRYCGHWKTVLSGLTFSSYSEKGSLDSFQESISLTARSRRDFYKGRPIDTSKAMSAIGR